MFNPSPPLTIDSHLLHLEIPQSPQMQEKLYSTPGASRRAWINQLCLQAFLPWFKEEIAPNAKVYPNIAALASFWELVNGTPIIFDTYRLVLIPTLAMDGDELQVPQEWVDIPEWAADYYIAVEVNPDDNWTHWRDVPHEAKLPLFGGWVRRCTRSDDVGVCRSRRGHGGARARCAVDRTAALPGRRARGLDDSRG